MSSENWVDYNPDVAMAKAFKQCGVDPAELKAKKLEDFRKSSKTPDETVQRRFNRFQEDRVKKLYAVVTARDDIIREEIRKPKPPKKEQSGGPSKPQKKDETSAEDKSNDDGCSTSASQNQSVHDEQKDALIARAKHQRQFWNTVNDRQQNASEKRKAAREQLEREAMERAARDRELAQEEEKRMIAIHEENQRLMKKRWHRDDELAQTRQKRVDDDVGTRKRSHQDHIQDINSARERRNRVLEVIMKTDSEENTLARLKRAKELRQKADEEVMQRTRATLEKAENRREEHIFAEFVKRTELANRALVERSNQEAALDRADEHRKRRAEAVTKRNEQVESRSMKAKEEKDGETSALREQHAAQRKEAAQKARERRIQQAEEREQRRLRAEADREQKEKERQEKISEQERVKREEQQAKHEEQQQRLQRVAKQTAARQEQNQAQLEARQQAVDERLKKLAEVRSLLEK